MEKRIRAEEREREAKKRSIFRTILDGGTDHGSLFAASSGKKTSQLRTRPCGAAFVNVNEINKFHEC